MKLSIKDYQDVHFSFNILTLYLNRTLILFGMGIIGIFEVIFLFEKFGNRIAPVAITFAAFFFLTNLLTPVIVRLISVIGMKRMMVIGVCFLFGEVLSLFFWDHNPTYALVGLITSITLFKSFYWIPYYVDFVHFTDKKTRGRQMSVLLTVFQIVGILVPLLGGFIIAQYGFHNLFLTSISILFFAMLPLFFLKEQYETYSFGYIETFKRLFSKKERPLLIGYAADGAQTSVTAVVWPIFIFLLLNGEFLIVGAVSSLTVFLIAIIRFLVGDLIDRWDKKRVFAIGAFLNTTGWIVKLFIETTFQIFLFDTYHKMGRAVNRMSIDATTYDQAADNGNYIDEFTVLKELSFNFGRIAMLLVIIFVTAFLSIKAAFVLAALASLFVTLLNRQAVLT